MKFNLKRTIRKFTKIELIFKLNYVYTVDIFKACDTTSHSFVFNVSTIYSGALKTLECIALECYAKGHSETGDEESVDVETCKRVRVDQVNL